MSEDQWIYIDLGWETLVNKVVLNWEEAYGKKYNIQVSTDEMKWKCTE